MVFVVAHLASQHGRVGRHDPPHFVAKIQRDRGEDVMARAATDEETRDGAVRVVVGLVPACRPTNHLELVVVTVTDHVAAGVGQTPYDVQVSGRGGPVHRVRVVPFLANVDVDSSREQQIDAREVAGERGEMQERVLVRLRADLQFVRILVEERSESLHVAVARRVEQLVVGTLRIRHRVRFARLLAAGNATPRPVRFRHSYRGKRP